MRAPRGIHLQDTLTPFLYPCLHKPFHLSNETALRVAKVRPLFNARYVSTDLHSSSSAAQATPTPINPSTSRRDHLDPAADSYSTTPFKDKCSLSVFTGGGGHGCVSFLREKYIEHGPPNGGDGGSGGNVYVQAVPGETSLHKLSRRGIVKAGRGKNGQGKTRGGERGEDVLFTVPVGTVVREVWRHDPVEEERKRIQELRRSKDEEDQERIDHLRRDKWIIFPGLAMKDFAKVELPRRSRVKKSQLAAAAVEAPIRLDLDEAMENPLLLAAGAAGGYGNPTYVTKESLRPHFASKGEPGMRIELELELKMLADVGLVGLPNAGKSTLLRALSNSRTRVGNWAFTTLQPNIGTVVLDDNNGRPLVPSLTKDGSPRTNFTVADIPGLIEDAHLDKGLGLGFLRHVERAAVLAFVIDLAAGDAVSALRALWKEVGEYETFRAKEISAETESRLEETQQIGGGSFLDLPKAAPPISSKPWFVVATKADLPETKENFAGLQTYIELLKQGLVEHPSGSKNGWKKGVTAVPISAIRAEGVQQIPQIVVDLLK